jgi:paraquat-inducible protein A
MTRGARAIAAWHVPLVLVAAALCLIAGVSLPLLAVREFFFYGRTISLIGGVLALLDHGDWVLAAILGLFSIVLPLVKILVLLALWWRSGEAWRSRRRLMNALQASARWAALDVFVVALVIVETKAELLLDAHIAGAVYPFLAAIGLTAYAAHAVARATPQAPSA